jgi:hypothetical protein
MEGARSPSYSHVHGGQGVRRAPIEGSP